MAAMRALSEASRMARTSSERRAQSLGAAILRGATELPGLGAFCVLQDPTGAELALWEDRVPS